MNNITDTTSSSRPNNIRDEIETLRTCDPENLIKDLKNKNRYSSEKLVQFIVYDLFKEENVLKDIINGWKSSQIDTKLFCDQIWVMPLRLRIIAKQSPIIMFFESESMSIPFRIVPRLVQASIFELINRSGETAEEIDNETKLYALGRKGEQNQQQEEEEEEEAVKAEKQCIEKKTHRSTGSDSPFQFLEKDDTNFCLVYSKFNYDSLMNETFPRLEITKCFIRSTINLSSTMRYDYHNNITNIIEILAVQQEGNSADVLISQKLLSINLSTLRALLSKIEKADFDLTQLDQIQQVDKIK